MRTECGVIGIAKIKKTEKEYFSLYFDTFIMRDITIRTNDNINKFLDKLTPDQDKLALGEDHHRGGVVCIPWSYVPAWCI